MRRRRTLPSWRLRMGALAALVIFSGATPSHCQDVDQVLDWVHFQYGYCPLPVDSKEFIRACQISLPSVSAQICATAYNRFTHDCNNKQERYNSCMGSNMGANRKDESPEQYCRGWAGYRSPVFPR